MKLSNKFFFFELFYKIGNNYPIDIFFFFSYFHSLYGLLCSILLHHSKVSSYQKSKAIKSFGIYKKGKNTHTEKKVRQKRRQKRQQTKCGEKTSIKLREDRSISSTFFSFSFYFSTEHASG